MKKMSFTFDIFILKLEYMATFIQVWEKNFGQFFSDIFLTNQGKNKDENEKIGKMSLIFEFSIYQNKPIFIKIWEKKFHS